MSISIVRALVVNVGVYEHFADSLGGRPELSSVPAPIVALTLVVLPFSFAIAVLKDVPDAEGDRRFRIATFTVKLGARRALAMSRLRALPSLAAGSVRATNGSPESRDFERHGHASGWAFARRVEAV